jgi:hypothetical protein
MKIRCKGCLLGRSSLKRFRHHNFNAGSSDCFLLISLLDHKAETTENGESTESLKACVSVFQKMKRFFF